MIINYDVYNISISCGREYDIIASDVEDAIARWHKMAHESQYLDCEKEECEVKACKSLREVTLIGSLPNHHGYE